MSKFDLRISWWNCGLAPPSNSDKKKKPPSTNFLRAVSALLIEHESDILGICEIDPDGIGALQSLFAHDNYRHFRIIDLYNKDDDTTDDFCIIVDTRKVTKVFDRVSLSHAQAVGSKAKLRAGVSIKALLHDETPLALILCHWQSRVSYSRDAVRLQLGMVVHEKVKALAEEGYSCIVFGDFNDEPFDDSLVYGLSANRDANLVRKKPSLLYNPYWNCLGTTVQDTKVAGTCLYTSTYEQSDSRTFDQIIFSSAFVQSGWEFIGLGAAILRSTLNDINSPSKWKKISDHYPVQSHIRRSPL